MADFWKRLIGLELWRQPPSPQAVAMLAGAARSWPLAVLVVGVALYLPLLGVRPLRFEEGRRALLAIDMLHGDAWWYLKVLGEPYINKPPFTPWMISAFAWLRGGVDEVAVRLPGIVFALVGALAAGRAASVLMPADRRIAALAAGLALLCSIFLLLKVRVGETDVTVTALCGLAFAIWIEGRWRGGLRVVHWLAIGACFACAALSKGPIPIVFPAVSMIAIPLLQRKYREAALAVAAIVLAHAPMAVWAWDNLTASNAGHWAVELRVAPNEKAPPIDLTRLLLLNDLPLTILYMMPFLPAAVAMALVRCELPREQRWPIDALVLYAVPITLLTTILPMGKARYAMPAAWPVAVLAGMWIAMKWRRLHLASLIVGGGLAIAVAVQVVQIGFMDGRTPGQRALRERAAELSAALATLPPGPLPVIWTGGDFNHNLLAYAGRRLYLLRPAELGCRTGGDYLLAGRSEHDAVAASGVWTGKATLSDVGLIFMRKADVSAADCVPAFRPR